MKPLALLTAHGMNVKNKGVTSIDLAVIGQPADVVDLDSMDYGFVLFGKIWFRKKPRIKKLSAAVKKYIDDGFKVVIFTHSNGLNFTIQALKKLEAEGVDISQIEVVAMSGCANRKVRIPSIKCVHNWHTKKDGWLKVSKYLPSWTMGSFGLGPYRGKSKNVINKDISNHIESHSQWYDKFTLPTTRRKIGELIEARK